MATKKCEFVTKVKKVGHSHWVLVPHTQLMITGIKAGDAVKVTVEKIEE